MSTPFQNRLVGTIIVAAVVIIFLPDVLDGKKKSNQVEFEAIPKAEMFTGKLTNKAFPEERLVRQKQTPIEFEPAIDEVSVITPAPASQQDNDIASIKIDTPKALSNNKPLPKVEAINTQKLPEKSVASEAWVIHLGSFKNQGNVEDLLKKLKSNGYIAFTKPIKTKKGTLTKVMIGPELIKSSMTQKIPALKKLTGIEGKVAFFDVNN